MKSEAVKLAQIEERRAAYKAISDAIVSIATNPVITVVGGVVVTEYLQSSVDRYSGQRVPGGGFMGSAAGSALEAALVGYLALNTVGKFTQDLKPVAEAIAPLLLTKGVV